MGFTSTNIPIVVLPSGARTTTQTSSDIVGGRTRLHLIVDVTSAGTGSITPKVQGRDANGVYYDLLVGSAITSDGTNVLKIGPGYTPSANAVATDSIPQTFRVIITHNNGNSITYSVAVELMGS